MGSTGSSAGGASGDDMVALGGAGEGGASRAALGGALSAAGAGTGGQTVGCDQPPQIVFVVSRAGTMFAGERPPWYDIRDASLSAFEKVQAPAELGFLAVSGAHDMCPILHEVAPAASSHGAIATMYEALVEQPVKGESPFMYALDRAGELLDGAGKKYIVFVLNGEADFCSDGFPGCPADSTIAHIQKLHRAGITTLVAAAPEPFPQDEQRTKAYEAALKGYANAGAGLPVESHEESKTLDDMCANAIAWQDELAASGDPERTTLADYAETGGNATYVNLDPRDVTGMTKALGSLLEGIASCD